jgi:hypothetical protein
VNAKGSRELNRDVQIRFLPVAVGKFGALTAAVTTKGAVDSSDFFSSLRSCDEAWTQKKVRLDIRISLSTYSVGLSWCRI